jgi:hypothetical protein
VQNEILSKYPTADLDVCVVWFNMYPGDARWRWDGGGMTDPRVVHYWDEQKSVGTWFGANLTGRSSLTWDFYALYSPDARDLASPSSMGGTVISRRAALQSALDPVLTAASQASAT